VKKGQPGPLKAKVHISRKKQMALVFFDAKGVIYIYKLRPPGQNRQCLLQQDCSDYSRFLKVFKEKRPIMLSQDCWLYRDNIPIHIATPVVDVLATKAIKTMPDLPCLPDLAPADCSLFPRVRSELVGMSLSQNIFKSSWDGAIKTAAFKRWMEQCQ
jgi:hypothetical protein